MGKAEINWVRLVNLFYFILFFSSPVPWDRNVSVCLLVGVLIKTRTKEGTCPSLLILLLPRFFCLFLATHHRATPHGAAVATKKRDARAKTQLNKQNYAMASLAFMADIRFRLPVRVDSILKIVLWDRLLLHTSDLDRIFVRCCRVKALRGSPTAPSPPPPEAMFK